jgi:sigma-E factor negative regulatory protein RseC
MAEKRISHDGVVDSLEGNEVVVRITSYAACSNCHARAACNVTGENDKYMRIKAAARQFSPGDRVRIILAQSLGFRALFLGYILPFLLVLTALLAASAAGASEPVAGLVSLSILPPYYLGLKLFRSRLERVFSFTLQKS